MIRHTMCFLRPPGGRSGNRPRLAALTLLTAAVLASPAAADVAVAPSALPSPRVTEIAGEGSHTVWSDQVRDENGQYPEVVLYRRQRRTVALPIQRPVELDVGLGPSGRPTAVYLRCTDTCRAYRYDLVAGRESRIRSVRHVGLAGAHPSVSGEHVAFLADRGVLLADLRASRAPTLLTPISFPEIELGRGALASVSFESRDQDHASVVLAVRPRYRGSRPRVLRDRIIGERCATGIGALQYEGFDLLWKEVHGCGCTVSGTRFFRLRNGQVRQRPRATMPIAVRFAPVSPPTPQGPSCGEE